MAYRLRKINPPFGTAEAPIWEYAYSEQVKVVDGVCCVENQATRDYLLKQGYEEVEEEAVLAGGNGSGDNSAIPGPAVGRESRKKKKRRR
jgi:hypothetical protein